MKSIQWMRICLRAMLLTQLAGCATASEQHSPASADVAQPDSSVLVIRNHHDLPYAGPLQFQSRLPDGDYRGVQGYGEIRNGLARVTVKLEAQSDARLQRTTAESAVSSAPPFAIRFHDSQITLRTQQASLGSLELGLVVLPGESAAVGDAIGAFHPAELSWEGSPRAGYHARFEQSGFQVEVTANAADMGVLDLHVRLVREEAVDGPAYVALVRRLVTPGLRQANLRFNGRQLEGADSPDLWDRDFWYTHGVDWISWKTNGATFLALSGFTPAPAVLLDSAWVDGSHFYVWEKTRAHGDSLYLVSEIAGPNAEQKLVQYGAIAAGAVIEFRQRIAVASEASPQWEESQLLVFAGYRAVSRDGPREVVDLGVPFVKFGTSYFPYSTLVENFDYYRTPGLDSETWWPFSAQMWEQWRAFEPRMLTDLHIIRAMGFSMVRLHHLELLRQMDASEAIAFLDWFTDAAHGLGLDIFVDTEGPVEWIAQIARRYAPAISRYELENEILIFGVKPGDAERWTEQYGTIKRVDPDADVFLTNSGNHGMFERLRALGVPFDRVGLHAYKHGPEWKEAFRSHALGTGGYATDIGKPATLGEFNWKSLTRLSPEARSSEFATIYGLMLEPRALPEFVQFHWQETLGVNPALGRSGIRHYETIALDRRPKPEAIELMKLIRRYADPQAPVRVLPVEIPESTFADGRASATFTVTNTTDRLLDVSLRGLSFDSIAVRVEPAELRLVPGQLVAGRVELQLPAGSTPGTRHYFIAAQYGAGTALGWGIAANPGAPRFSSESAVDGVAYPQGRAVVERINWEKPLYVAFGAEAPVLELEMAYLTGNTLQSATGRRVRISSTADLPPDWDRGTVILVGTPASNPLISGSDQRGTGASVVLLTEGAGQRVLLTGDTPRDVERAAVDFVLRYWPRARDAAARITGLEPGAALGHRLLIIKKDPP